MNQGISVICPIRNMEGRMKNLNSWLQQCGPLFQIIFICDSCSDNTAEELKKIRASRSDLEIEILEGRFGNPGSARNWGLENTKYDWVAFWDSDDVGNPNLLLETVNGKNSSEFDAIVFRYQVFAGDREIRESSLWPKSNNKSVQLLTLDPGIWRICFKRSSLSGVKFPGLKMAEDQIFLDEYLSKIPNIEFSNSIGYRYFVNVEGQLTSNFSALEDLVEAGDILSRKLRIKSKGQQYTLRIYCKLLFTQLKKCRFATKMNAGTRIISLLFNYPLQTSYLFVQILGAKLK